MRTETAPAKKSSRTWHKCEPDFPCLEVRTMKGHLAHVTRSPNVGIARVYASKSRALTPGVLYLGAYLLSDETLRRGIPWFYTLSNGARSSDEIGGAALLRVVELFLPKRDGQKTCETPSCAGGIGARARRYSKAKPASRREFNKERKGKARR